MEEELRKIFAAASFLLQYPDGTWQADWDSWKEEMETIKNEQIRSAFTDLFAHLDTLGINELTESYVRLFDFSKNTNLYLTSYQYGDQRERSQEMLRYKEVFLAGGFDIRGELPDYLPAILEFCSVAEVNFVRKILAISQKNIEDLRQKLIEAEAAYVIVFDVILTAANLLPGDE
jgi:nitrate reductase molybdenum cofactor assembly chaperone NarJ/NarW